MRRGLGGISPAAGDCGLLEPPDTDLLRWGSVMGLIEVTAYERVEEALHDAVAAGALRPGGAGWKAAADGLSKHVLLGPVPGTIGRNWLSLIIEERVGAWVALAHPAQLRARRVAVADRLLSPPPPPAADALERVVRPMRWLLEACRSGLTLTQSGYLPPALVHEGVDLFGWWEWRGRPRSEADVGQLADLRETASRQKLLTKRGRRLTTSRAGLRLLDDPDELWRTIAAGLGCFDGYSTMISELIAHRLLDGPAQQEELAAEVTPIIQAQDWRSGGVPLDGPRIAASIHEPLRYWRLFGLIDEQQPRWEHGMRTVPWVVSLTVAGRATALAHLHARATGPRSGQHD